MRLSIIIIEFHCMNQVESCINSVIQYLGDQDTECLVVSNSEYSSEKIEKYKPLVRDGRVIRAPRNMGYSGGVNMALKEARGEYVYILNPDCRLTDSNVIFIMSEMDKSAEWAISGPKVIDENEVIQPSCRRFPKPWTFLLVRSLFARLPGTHRERSRYLMDDYEREFSREVDWVSGGATLVKRAALKKIGRMDERYFLYMEDVDWCRAAWEHGFKVTYCTESTVIHAGMHQSIRGGLHVFASTHFRWHISSLIKYFRKYKWRALPNSIFYHKSMDEVYAPGASAKNEQRCLK